ncbi:hypothetical protein PPL_02623 [Heterostelium album PN500]|uniref:Uncharacterized protein n=1 Tax=Heterostelium pallidum (strain ATCC 26659 / Pp 5 / PN500) TaxID=670386 RepID=D3B2K9_HETP5|nr:hypothetical protein PPL_02623 [Heterostelium album PN500]EFA83557.1 hypothetical protein PPL_02623 [Heterostelium album PN500]|eukprot:XP_020435674.1 hypothetical protein PPL_02623 [Heterostelium album PN500]
MEPFSLEVLMDDLYVDSFKDNVVTGSFDVVISVCEEYSEERLSMVVWLKKDQLTKEEEILGIYLKFKDSKVKTIEVPFNAPLTDDTLIKVRVNGFIRCKELDIGISLIDGQPRLENYHCRNGRSNNKGYRIYHYSDSNNEYDRFRLNWFATDSYSIDDLSIGAFSDYCPSISTVNVVIYTFNTYNRIKPTLEQYADIICHQASKMDAISISLFYRDQHHSVYQKKINRYEIDDFDSHILLDLLKLGYQHWIDLECQTQSKEASLKKYFLIYQFI